MVSDRFLKICSWCWGSRLNPCCAGLWSLTNFLQNKNCSNRKVLILVVLDYGLWLCFLKRIRTMRVTVLILVVLDYGLWLIIPQQNDPDNPRLNPCCAGLWSLTDKEVRLRWELLKSLNPCCAGLWSLTLRLRSNRGPWSRVLILVVLDYGLWLKHRGVTGRRVKLS